MSEETYTEAAHCAKCRLARQWAWLVGLSVLGAVLLTLAGIPAALLLGPLLGGAAVAYRGAALQIPRRGFALAQGLLGCMIAKALPMSISGAAIGDWPVLLFGVVAVIAVSALLGWVLTRMRALPGTTAIWGLSPGAATVMTLMAESFGADAQLVAFMQYTRVVLVAAIASIIASGTGGGAPHAVQPTIWFPALAWEPFLETLAVAALGSVIGGRLKLRAGALLIPLIAGAVLVRHGWIGIELPRWLLAIAYAFIGWRIGLRFTRPLLRHAIKTLPVILACSAALIVACGGFAAVLVVAAHIDPLTAYLATSPGGADSVAIIAASSRVDVPFVMTMQMARFIVVLIAGPAIARFIAGRVRPDGAAATPNRFTTNEGAP